MAKKPSWFARNAYRRQRRLEAPDIPKPLQWRDLAGFRFEYWYSSVDEYDIVRYFRNRSAAVHDAKDRKLVMPDIMRIRVITSDGHRGWSIDVVGDTAYVRTHRTRAAEREARVARRVRAKQAAAPVAA